MSSTREKNFSYLYYNKLLATYDVKLSLEYKISEFFCGGKIASGFVK